MVSSSGVVSPCWGQLAMSRDILVPRDASEHLTTHVGINDLCGSHSLQCQGWEILVYTRTQRLENPGGSCVLDLHEISQVSHVFFLNRWGLSNSNLQVREQTTGGAASCPDFTAGPWWGRVLKSGPHDPLSGQIGEWHE